MEVSKVVSEGIESSENKNLVLVSDSDQVIQISSAYEGFGNGTDQGFDNGDQKIELISSAGQGFDNGDHKIEASSGGQGFENGDKEIQIPVTDQEHDDGDPEIKISTVDQEFDKGDPKIKLSSADQGFDDVQDQETEIFSADQGLDEEKKPSSSSAAASKPTKKNLIHVSNTKKPFLFYLNLAKKYIKLYKGVELCALGKAIPVVVSISEILKHDKLAVEKKIGISSVARQDGKRLLMKAKIEVVLEKSENVMGEQQVLEEQN